MSQAAIFKQNSYTSPTNFIDVEKYVGMLLGFGETHLEKLLLYLKTYYKSTGQISSIEAFNRKLERLVTEFSYKLRTVLNIDELSIIVCYFEDVLYYVTEIVAASQRKHEFDKDLHFCYETLEAFAKITQRYDLH